MKTKYRLVVDRGFSVSFYAKRDLEHAEEGVKDSYRDFKLHGDKATDWEAWIETSEVGKWEKWKVGSRDVT